MTGKVIRVIELFSGVGGFHLALKSLIESSKSLQNHTLEVYPFDNNIHANKLYQHNFNIKPNNKNIEHLKPMDFDRIKPFIITLSPPCQPYTRGGTQKGAQDQRSNALHHFCDQILRNIKHLPKYIILENVIGFESSKSCQIFLKTIIDCNYKYKIYSINPTQIGIPNTRKRIYILCKLNDYECKNDENDIKINIITKLAIRNEVKQSIGDIIKIINNSNNEYIVSMNRINKCKGYKFNIVTINDYDSECFTKAYSTKKNHSKGTGSLFASKLIRNEDIIEFKTKYEYLFKNKCEDNHQEIMALLSKVGLRYFSPREMSLLMGFPLRFVFPNDMNQYQFYKLIGNSVNVRVITILLSVLVDNVD